MLDVTFLGINGSVQQQGGGNTSLLVQTENSCVLVDTSCNLCVAVEAEPDVVVITHQHIDHVYGLVSFLHQSWISKRQKPLIIMCPEGINGLIDSLIGIFSIKQKKGMFDIKISNYQSTVINGLEINTFKTKHTDSSIGLVFVKDSKKLVYTCDTPPVVNPPAILFDADLLIHETNSTKDTVKPDHSCGFDAGKLACETKAKSLMLCHLPKNDVTKEKILNEAKSLYEFVVIPEILKKYTVG